MVKKKAGLSIITQLVIFKKQEFFESTSCFR